jgi:hypothetical protein
MELSCKTVWLLTVVAVGLASVSVVPPPDAIVVAT